jgi:quercetin dioxygenase-like cupin family protein
MHPRGVEIFYIIEGEYRFVLGNRLLNATTGDVLIIPKNTPHRFTVGSSGGKVLITSPPELENYFSQVSDLLSKGSVTWETESNIARQYGQVFLENVNHW